MVCRTVLTLFVMIGLLLPATASTAQELPDYRTLIDQEMVMAHIEALSVNIGARVGGTESEAEAADYIASPFEDRGYEVEIQEFEMASDGHGDDYADDYSDDYADDYSDDYSDEYTEAFEPDISRNVIATRPGDDQMVVVGAHMDSVSDGTGAGDNASGVAAMLAAAEVLADLNITHTLVFVAFGAEESGAYGSKYFVESLGDQIDNVIAMINLDSVGVGTIVNVYAGAKISWPEGEDNAPDIDGGPVWVRDLALDFAAEMNLPLGTTPDETWGGFTGDWSDHYPFVLQGVPVAYFEAWFWEGAEDPWWGQETAEGDVMHTPDDIYENVVPEKVELTAEVLAATTAAIATGMAEGE
jgi:acetylornithine deacetylase/succinyl-diaminopimelate desuccinylase-like protein